MRVAGSGEGAVEPAQAGQGRRPSRKLCPIRPPPIWAFLLVFSALLPPTRAFAQWIEPRGSGWAALTIYHQDTREVFGVAGSRRSFAGGGRALATSSYLTVTAGLGRSFDAWAQLPFLRLRFSDITGIRTSTGFGDARLYVRFGPLAWLGSPFPLAIRLGTKLPIGDFDVGTSLIPLGDGQRDWEAMVELGHSFFPRAVYAMSWVGYRWREARTSGRVEFGDEWFFYVAAGGEGGRLGWKLALEGWYGATPVFNAIRAQGGEREMLRASPSVLFAVGPGQIELGVRSPLEGRNLLAGTDWVLGYFTRFGL